MTVPHGSTVAERLLRCAPHAARELAAMNNDSTETVIEDLRNYLLSEKLGRTLHDTERCMVAMLSTYVHVEDCQ